MHIRDQALLSGSTVGSATRSHLSRGDGALPALFVAQRHAHRFAEAERDAVASFHAWHKLGRFVKKGEKGILILAPIIRKKTKNNGETEPDESSTAVGFSAAYVFDITQTDGQPLS
jgi:N-terminal domain of anti-restriction factor ArdC